MSPSLAIIGLGLIGSSLARAVRGQYREIVGLDRSPEVLSKAVASGVIDRIGDPSSMDADMTVFCVPVGAMQPVMKQCREAGWPGPGQLATDVGSIKQQVLDDVHAVFGQVDWFVPGHPLAGSEQHGLCAGRADMFRDQLVLLTPPPWVATDVLDRVKALWRNAGARLEVMPVERHDRLLAQTSHLPHLLAYALVDTLVRGPDGDEVLRYAAGGFRDFTRIAASDPQLWRDIFLSNQEALLASLDQFENRLRLFRRLLQEPDLEALLKHMETAQAARRRFVERQDAGLK